MTQPPSSLLTEGGEKQAHPPHDCSGAPHPPPAAPPGPGAPQRSAPPATARAAWWHRSLDGAVSERVSSATNRLRTSLAISQARRPIPPLLPPPRRAHVCGCVPVF